MNATEIVLAVMGVIVLIWCAFGLNGMYKMGLRHGACRERMRARHASSRIVSDANMAMIKAGLAVAQAKMEGRPVIIDGEPVAPKPRSRR